MKKFKLALAAAVASVALTSAPASAQGIPVIDPGNIAQTVKVVQNGIQQVQQLKQQVQQMTQMATTIGQGGIASLANLALKSAGLNFSDPANSPVAQYRAAMPGLLDALPGSAAGTSVGIDSGLAQSAKSNIQDARQFALQAFYKSGSATVDEIGARQGLREAAIRDSVTSGYAMAVYTKNNLTNSETQMKSLGDSVSGAKDLREDVQANSAIALAQLQQVTVQNQLLAQLLEVNSTSSMASAQTGASRQ